MKAACLLCVWLCASVASAADPWKVYAARPPLVPKGTVDTDAKRKLGLMVFQDNRLSSTRTHSCASCHKSEFGWGDGERVSSGATAKTTRNSPTIINTAFLQELFHDKRAIFLEGQAPEPMKSVDELGQGNTGVVVARFRRVPQYEQLFREAFGPRTDNAGRELSAITESRMAAALAAFQRTIVSTDAPVDRAVTWSVGDRGQWIYEVRPDANWVFTPAQSRGFNVFFGKGRCIQCHQSPDYRTDNIANNGMGAYNGYRGDQGAAQITGNDSDTRAFAIPTLRELGRTAPYGHAGHLPTIRDVVAHYSNPPADRFRDRRIQPARFTDQEAEDLTAFLTVGFQGKNYPTLAKLELPPDPPGTPARDNQQTGRRGILRRR